MYSRLFHSFCRQSVLSILLAACVAATTLHAQESTPAAGPVLTLEDAIQLALKHNKQIKVGSFYTPIAKANVTAAYGAFDPSLNFNRSYSQDITPFSSNPLTQGFAQGDNYGLALEGLTPWGLTYSLGAQAQHSHVTANNHLYDAGYYYSFAGVQVTQPLLRGFGFGANLAGLRVAKANRNIADWQFRQLVIDTITATKNAYYSLGLAHQRLRINILSQKRAETLIEESEKRFKVGATSENEVIVARAQNATTAESIIIARQQLRDAENVLRQWIGEENFPMDGTFYTLQDLEPVNEMVNPPEDLKKAYILRPDYQALKLGLVRDRAQLAFARNQLLPTLNFVGSYGYAGLDRDFADSRRMVSDRQNNAYSAGLVVSIPITFASGRGQARAARLQLQQSEANLGLLEQEIALAVTEAAGQIDTTRQRVAANRTTYDLQKQKLDGEVKRLRAGTTTTFFVAQYQLDLANAELSLYASLNAQRVAVANYDSVIGRTLEQNHITLEK